MLYEMLTNVWLVTGLAIAILSAFAYALFKRSHSISDRFERVQVRNRFFQADERRLFDTMCDGLDHGYYIFPKVGIGDLVIGTSKLSQRSLNLNQRTPAKASWQSEVMDFVICDKKDFSIVAVVELERFDNNESNRKNAARNILISQICDAMKVKLFHFDTRLDYDSSDVRRIITGRAKSGAHSRAGSKLEEKIAHAQEIHRRNKRIESESMITEYLNTTKCPQCNSDLITRVAKNGENIGKRFLMCRKYPYCDYKASLDETKVAATNSKKAKASEAENKSGYSEWAG